MSKEERLKAILDLFDQGVIVVPPPDVNMALGLEHSCSIPQPDYTADHIRVKVTTKTKIRAWSDRPFFRDNLPAETPSIFGPRKDTDE